MSDWSDDEGGRVLWIVLAAIAVLFGSGYYVAHYEECTKTHPGWYCL